MGSRCRRRTAWVLGVLVTLTGCTPIEPPQGVIDLSVDGDVVTALLDRGDRGAELYESHDRGATWALIAEAGHWDQFPDRQIQTESQVCDSGDRCFRIDEPSSETAVWEVSTNGEESPAWSFPPGRLEFLERYELDSVYGAYDPGPRDIVAVGDVVLVAMGNDGVLRGSENGEWQRGVLGDPRPFSEWGANLYSEVVFGLMATALVMAVVMLSAFAARARKEGARLWRSLGPWTVLGYITTVPALFLVLLLGVIGSSTGILLFLLPTLGAVIATWLVMFPGGSARVARWPLILILAVPVGAASALGVFLLWSGGVIPWYPLARALALLLAGAATVLAIVASVRSLPPQMASSRLPSREPPPEPVAPAGVAISWAGASIVATGTLAGALVFLLPSHLGIEEGPNGALFRYLTAALAIGVALIVAGLRHRSRQGVRRGLAGLGATLLAGPGVGTMMVIPPTPPARTLLRVATYTLYWISGAGVMIAVGALGSAPGAVTFSFGALLTMSPFCVPVADWWARRRQPGQVSTPA